ncbi:MAG: hypothetical protein A3E78_15070 [Alphaproteobacteria bacterium RIFCSPHIGHO2_12_FULL_63_12]|nr:MAG: hypothetical protein A3E78_15070 [Alphaproteobacteria bacterium RIFCSPHIGHO2_12_FULL_63_12]
MMDMFFSWPVWIIWSVGLMLLVRAGMVFAFKRFRRSPRAFFWAYLSIACLLPIGLLIVGLSGMPMYGFDQDNWRHMFGYIVLYFSPLGVPVILGTPFVLLMDVLRRPWRKQPTEITPNQ